MHIDLKLKEEDFLNHLFLLKIDSVIIVYRKSKMNFIFLIKCSKYNSPRNNLFSVVQINCRNFCSLEDKVKFNWLLANSDKNVIIELSNFLFESFALHALY